MVVVLVVLNVVYLLCSLYLNAELLNLAGADVPLKDLGSLEVYGQTLAAASMCLLAWRYCLRRYQSQPKKLLLTMCLSTAVITPISWFVQGEAPEIIAEQFPDSLRLASLQAYVVKKGLLYGSVSLRDLPYEAYLPY